MKQRFLLLTAVFTLAVSLVASGGFPQLAYAATPYNASNVLGQPDFTSASPATTQSGLTYGQAAAVDNVNHRLFVADTGNNRVLVYNTTTITNGMNASNVLGQANFTSNTVATTQSGMSAPAKPIYDSINNRLFVPDINNNRVLVYDTTTITNGMNASNVLGQANFTSNTAATTQNGMGGPRNLGYDMINNRLFVPDFAFNRVLVYNTTTITNGMNASNVLGQANFTSSTAATTQNGLRTPSGTSYDSNNNRLFVSESNNRRVLVYDTTAITNGMNASNVIGQPNFTSSTGATTQSGMGAAVSVAYDSTHNRLFVSDYDSARVLGFNVATITNGMNASYVIGKPNFTTGASGICDQSNTSPPGGLAYDTVNNRLFVPDTFCARVLVFNFAKLASSSLPPGTAGVAYSTTLSASQTQGTTSYAVTSGALPPGLSLNNSTGILSGTPTTAGTYNFSVSVSDDNGVAGVYTDTNSYTIAVSAGVGAAATTPTAPNTGTNQTPLAPSLLLLIAGTGISLVGLRAYAKQRGYKISSRA